MSADLDIFKYINDKRFLYDEQKVAVNRFIKSTFSKNWGKREEIRYILFGVAYRLFAHLFFDEKINLGILNDRVKTVKIVEVEISDLFTTWKDIPHFCGLSADAEMVCELVEALKKNISLDKNKKYELISLYIPFPDLADEKVMIALTMLESA